MLVKNALIYVGKQFVNMDLEFDDKFRNLGPSLDENSDAIDGKDMYIIPGLVDIHTHGAMGTDFSDGIVADIPKALDFYARHGVTSVLPTTMTLAEEDICKALDTISSYQCGSGANIAGINLEGPFLSKEKRGAQAESFIQKPDAALFDKFFEASKDTIKVLTLACEEDGSKDFIASVKKKAVISLGHSVANYEQAMEAFESGASHATHLFNAMGSMGHRDSGIVGAAYEKAKSVELICDGNHISDSVIKMVFKLFEDRVCLISDSLRCTGLPDGEYPFGGDYLELKNGVAKMKGTATLAGSVITVFDAMKKVISLGIAKEAAVYAASTAPAEALGLSCGKIEQGYNADFLMLDKDFNLKAVYISGKCYWRENA